MNTNDLIIIENQGIAVENEALRVLGQMADQYSRNNVFERYQKGIAANTERRQKNDLQLFADFLNGKIEAMREHGFKGQNVTLDSLKTTGAAWVYITKGLLDAFIEWMEGEGYAFGTINARLSTVKAYINLAYEAGFIDIAVYGQLKLVTTISKSEAINRDENRKKAGTPRRIIREGAPNKKSEKVTISLIQARALKRNHPDTPQGRRDALMMCLLLDHGLRASEAAILKVGDINFDYVENGIITPAMVFYRPKIKETHLHYLSPDTLKAARAYFENDVQTDETGALRKELCLLRAHQKAGCLRENVIDANGEAVKGMTERSITRRVKELGEALGKVLGDEKTYKLVGLSAHDCRHYGASNLAQGGTDSRCIKNWGGWHGYAMVDRYVQATTAYNEGINPIY